MDLRSIEIEILLLRLDRAFRTLWPSDFHKPPRREQNGWFDDGNPPLSIRLGKSVLHIGSMIGLGFDLAHGVGKVLAGGSPAVTGNLLPFNYNLIFRDRFETMQAQEMLCCQWLQAQVLRRKPLVDESGSGVLLTTPGRHDSGIIHN